MITQKNAKFVSFHSYVQTLKGASHFVNAWILFLNMYNVGRFELTRIGTDFLLLSFENAHNVPFIVFRFTCKTDAVITLLFQHMVSCLVS